LITLSFDQSTKVTGWNSMSPEGELLQYGIYDISNVENASQRIYLMKKFVDDTVHKTKAEVFSIENVQFQQNYKSFEELSKLLGTLETYFIENHLLYFIVSPSQWKSYIGLKSRKRKEQKQEMIQYVKNRYKKTLAEDICDSIGISLYTVNVLLPKIKVIGE
jgi:Holliday junction resolvasome RuvABC endonuclease subunit